MTDIEKDALIEKWNPFMEGLNKSKTKRFKYACIYENIVLNNFPNNHKMLLALAYQLFKKKDDIKLSSSKGDRKYIDIHSYERKDLYNEHNNIIPQVAIVYNAAISLQIIDKIDKIAYIKIEQNDTLDIIRVYY